jgi:glycosyltransferase involved in cell wall biosynthesis
VFAQTYRDFEVVVVNDGSPDTPALEAALEPYRSRIVYVRQENKRCAGARNTAIRKARGEFFAFLDSDDSWLPDHLTFQMQLFEKNASLDLVYADALLISDGARQKTFMEKCPSLGEATFESLVVERCQIPISTVVARRAAILRAGPFDESLRQCDDYDMWLRAAFYGAKIGYGKSAQARLNLGRPESLGQSRAKMIEAAWKILENTQQALPLNQAQRKLVQQRAAEIRARHLVEQGKLQLRERHPEKACELFAEANRHLRMQKLSIAIRGLRLAPQATSRLISVWDRFLSALTV